MVLPYYKLEKTEEGRKFFYTNLGYFNFWDDYLIANTEESNGELFFVLVNRTGRNFSCPKASDKQRECMENALADSVCLRKPEEMFEDFPELETYDWLKEYSKYYTEVNENGKTN